MYSYVRNSPLNLTDPTGMVYEVCMNGYDITYAGGCNELPGDTVGELNDYLSQYPGNLKAEGDPNSFGGSGSIVSLAHSDTVGTYEFEEPDALGTTITVSGNPPYTPWSPLVEINPGQPGTPSGQGDPGGSGGMSPSPQSPGSPQQPQRNACTEKVLSAVNNEFGSAPYSVDGNPFNYPPGGTFDLNLSGNNLPAAQFNATQPGRYPVNWWTYLIGYGPTLHVTGQSFFDPTASFQNSNMGGLSSVNFTAHIDYGFPFNPFGALYHLFREVLHVGGRRKPC